ncbi:MAG TPA: ABC transporter permease [Candidatus Limnocylindria bacterium]|nr:ABC transporter permease [Candidatus Limnocylindria bacterium]
MTWLARRALQAVVTALIALTLLFFLVRSLPGDPLAILSEDRPLTSAQVQDLRRRYQLDQPLGTQFVAFMTGALRGDFGTSIQYGRPVRQLVLERLPRTILLGAVVLLINFTLGLWLGVQQALHRGRPLDRLLTTLSLAGYAMPSFWLGLMLVMAFAVRWHWLPAAGAQDPGLEGAGILTIVTDRLRHLLLPAFTLAAVSIASSMRYQRAAMMDALRQPYVAAASARGLTRRRVVWGHAWRSALPSVLTLFGLWLPILVVGAVFVEQVFAWQGIGSLTAGAAAARDYPLLMGSAVLATAAVVTGSFLSDVLHALLDPRVRTG